MSGQPGQVNRSWTEAESAVVREHYPTTGYKKCLELLPHRTEDQIRAFVSRHHIYSDSQRSRRKWPLPTPDGDEILRRAYRHAEKTPSVKAIAKSTGWPASWVQYRAAELGLTRRKTGAVGIPGTGWTPEENALIESGLEDGITVGSIHKRLKKAGFRRSMSAIQTHISKLKLSFNRDFLNASDVAAYFSVDAKVVTQWIHRGFLRASKAKGPSRIDRGEAWYWSISRHDLARFLRKYPACWDHRRVSSTAVLLDILFPELSRFEELEPGGYESPLPEAELRIAA